MFNCGYNTLGIVASGICATPRDVGDKVVNAKDLIADQFEIGIFRIVNADENDPLLRQELLKKLEARVHHAEPLVVASQIFPLFADNLP